MKLSHLLSPRHIMPDLKGRGWEEVVSEMLDHLVKVGDIAPEQVAAILAGLREREEILSTGVGNGVAIPHVFSEDLNEVVAVFGRSRQGVDFFALDGQLVHYVVLFVSPKKSYQKHLLALAAIARMFARLETRKAMETSESVEEFHKLFRQRSIFMKE